MDRINFPDRKNIYLRYLQVLNNVTFTLREVDVIACILNNRGDKKIALLLSIAPKTVSSHIRNIMTKLGCNCKEHIIDLVEQSGKLKTFRQYYDSLLIINLFENFLIKVKKMLVKDPVFVEFLYNSSANMQVLPILNQLEEHLKIANIFVQTNQSQNFNGGKTIKFNLSIEHVQKKVTIDAHQDPLEKRIEFCQESNYFFSFSDLLETILHNTQIQKLAEQFKNDYLSFYDPRNELSLNKTLTTNNKYFSFRPFLTTIIFTVAATISLASFFLFDGKNPNSQHNTQKTNLNTKQITSYIPEFLTGHEKFIGRETELEQIKKILDKDSMLVITGQPGVGKSSCAIEYAKRSKSNKIIVRYFDADDTSKIDQKYRELAEELNINPRQQIKSVVMQLVNNKLDNLENKILFIFDNVEEYDHVKEYLINLPTNIKTIITTRKPLLIATVPHINLHNFSIKDAIAYMQNMLRNRYSENDLRELIQGTGTLPYNLKRKAAHLLDIPSVSLKSLMGRISGKFEDKLFQELATATNKEKQIAWKILQYTAYLDPDFISMQIINELFPNTEKALSKALKKLEELSYISIIIAKNNERGIRLHRNLQQDTKSSMQNNPSFALKESEVKKLLLATLDNLFPEVDDNPDYKWHSADSLQACVKKLLHTTDIVNTKTNILQQANLYFKLSKYYLEVNIDYEQALKYANTSLLLRKELYAINNSQIADAFDFLGKIYRKIGKAQEGLHFILQGLEIRQKLFNGNHEKIADSLFHAAMTYIELGESGDSANQAKDLEYSLKALKMRQKIYPPNHPKIASALARVGAGYIYKRDFDKSILYLQESLKMYETLNLVNHSDAAFVLHCIAWHYYRSGNYAKAIYYAEKTLNLLQSLYPDGHPRIADTLDTLGTLLVRTGKVDRGLLKLNESLEMAKKFKITKHYYTAFIFCNLGLAYYKNGNYQTALKFAEQGLKLKQEIYANVKNHLEIFEALDTLADIQYMLGKKTEALKLYKEAFIMGSALSLDDYWQTKEIHNKITQLF